VSDLQIRKKEGKKERKPLRGKDIIENLKRTREMSERFLIQIADSWNSNCITGCSDR